MDKRTLAKEVYFVLKSDISVKDGPYQKFYNNRLILTGFFKNGQKDSVWETYSGGIVQSRQRYTQGKRTGKWELLYNNGDPKYTYDRTTGQVIDGTASESDTTTDFYLTDAGQWVRAKLDHGPLPLSSPVEWLNYLNNNFHYPDDAVDKHVQGRVIVSIVVDENGDASNYAIYQTAGASLDREALRVVSTFDNLFAPAEKDGKKVKSLYLQPIEFKLDSSN